MSEFDTDGTKEIVCPYCGYTFTDSWELQDDQNKELPVECGKCEKNFIYSTDYDVTFSSRKCDCLNGAEHNWSKARRLCENVYQKTCKWCGKEENITC